MLATSLTATVLGVEAHLVRVEADSAPGFPRFVMVGLPDSAVKESESRIRAALRNCGLELKWDRRITVNLAPASLRKSGSSFDLATALGLLAADGQHPHAPPRPRAAGRRAGARRHPARRGRRAADASARPQTRAVGGRRARRQSQRGRARPGPAGAPGRLAPAGARDSSGLASCRPPHRPRGASTGRVPGRTCATCAASRSPAARLEIAAAGGHNLLFSGPPGSGKTMLARTAARAVAAADARGVGRGRGRLLRRRAAGRRRPCRRRPFRSPHHTTSDIALVGGGIRPRPGEVSLAHHGVLFLDELPEFRRATLEVLRQPLEEGYVTVSRQRGSVRLPARFQLVGAMNPCPCGRTARRSPAAARPLRCGPTSAGCRAPCSTVSTCTRSSRR